MFSLSFNDETESNVFTNNSYRHSLFKNIKIVDCISTEQSRILSTTWLFVLIFGFFLGYMGIAKKTLIFILFFYRFFNILYSIKYKYYSFYGSVARNVWYNFTNYKINNRFNIYIVIGSMIMILR